MSTGGVLTLGEALGMVRTNGPDGLDRAASAALGTGGAEANVAIGLARLDVPVTWLGRVGDDELGRRITRELRAEGVDTVALVDPVAATGLMLKDSARPGRTVVRFYRDGSAGSRLTPADLDRVDVAAARWLHVTGIPLALSPTAADAIFEAVRRARDAGLTVSFDVNHRARLWSLADAAPVYRRLAPLCDVVFGGDDELRALAAGDDPETLAAAVAALGPTEVVVKCGDRGAGAWTHDAWHWSDAVPVDVADTVGAGDAFVAGYISARIEDHDAATALERAVRTGAAACTHPGDWEGALYRSDLTAPAGDPVIR